MIFEDRSVATGVEQTISCRISGLSQNSPVIWIDPDDREISDTDINNYVIDQGNYDAGDKTATLTIKLAVLQNLEQTSVYKCKVKSGLYPDNSPHVEKEMTLTLLGLGKIT